MHSVKKVTDFALVDSGEVHYLRVVAIEFPRQGIWTVGLVTGEGMTDIAGAAGEPCVTVAVPGSPVPFTGNVVTVPESGPRFERDDRRSAAVFHFLRRRRAAARTAGQGRSRDIRHRPPRLNLPADVIQRRGKSRNHEPHSRRSASALAPARWPAGRPSGFPMRLSPPGMARHWCRSRPAATFSKSLRSSNSALAAYSRRNCSGHCSPATSTSPCIVSKICPPNRLTD